MNPENPLPPLLKPKEAAAVLAISARTLWTLTNCGAVPAVRIGRNVRYDPLALREWIDEKRTKTHSFGR